MQVKHIDHCNLQENQIFNPDFETPNMSGNFPAGWEKYTQGPLAVIYWQKNYKHRHCIMISNPFHGEKASIFQQPPFYVPVGEQELWEAGARCRIYRKMRAVMTVHFLNNHIPVSRQQLEFHLMPGIRSYSGSIHIPDDIDQAYLELGTEDSGQFWIENVFLSKRFPPPSTINVNTVEAVKKIIQPVKIEKLTRDSVETGLAGPILQTSEIRDVLKLSNFTFGVLNEGLTAAWVQLQTSPDGIHFLDEPTSDLILPAGQIRGYTPNQFFRYARMLYWTEDGNTTPLRIFFQGQG